MAMVVVGRWRPKPGEKVEDFEIPGPGLYEADFGLPAWLVPDYQTTRVFTVDVGEYKVTHLASESRASGVLTVRVKIERDPSKTALPAVEWVGVALTVGRVLGALAVGTVGALLMSQLVKMLVEIRKIGETPAGLGLAALGVAGAVLLLTGGKGGS